MKHGLLWFGGIVGVAVWIIGSGCLFVVEKVNPGLGLLAYITGVAVGLKILGFAGTLAIAGAYHLQPMPRRDRWATLLSLWVGAWLLHAMIFVCADWNWFSGRGLARLAISAVAVAFIVDSCRHAVRGNNHQPQPSLTGQPTDEPDPEMLVRITELCRVAQQEMRSRPAGRFDSSLVPPVGPMVALDRITRDVVRRQVAERLHPTKPINP